jgi:uncharacterized protein (TIGR03435 family)
MKRLAATLLLTVIPLFPRLIAQTSNTLNSTPPAAAAPDPTPPTIKFDVVYFKRCEAIDLVNKNTVTTGDSLGRQCQPLRALFNYAYTGGAPYSLKGEPDWVDTDAYDFQAKVAPENALTWQKMDLPTKRLMMRAMFAEVLKLKMHNEVESRPVYNLVVAKGGPKLTPSKPDPNAPADAQTPLRGSVNWDAPDEAVYMNSPMADLASGLSARLGRHVVDMTGLTGRYDFRVKPLPYQIYSAKTADVDSTDFAGIIDGVKDLGLKLEPGKADTTVLVIDHIDRPPEN